LNSFANDYIDNTGVKNYLRVILLRHLLLYNVRKIFFHSELFRFDCENKCCFDALKILKSQKIVLSIIFA